MINKITLMDGAFDTPYTSPYGNFLSPGHHFSLIVFGLITPKGFPVVTQLLILC